MERAPTVSDRAALLGRIRTNLKRTAGPPPPPPPIRLRVEEEGLARRVAQFQTALEALAGSVHVAASAAQVKETLARVLNGRTAVAARTPFLLDTGVFDIAGVEPLADDIKAHTARVDIGITGATYGLADTGSLVMMASEDPRLPSLLPPIHVALLPRERLLSGLDEFFSLHPVPSRSTSSVVFITGPSRTADIEQILVRGVHGPGEIHVILV